VARMVRRSAGFVKRFGSLIISRAKIELADNYLEYSKLGL